MSEKCLEINGISGVPNYSVREFKQKKHNCAIVLPVINEGNRIINQVKMMKSLESDFDVIVADGDSSDESKGFLINGRHGLSCLLIKKDEGRLSAQLRMAFHFCEKRGYEYVITMDGNGKDVLSSAYEIKRVLESGYDFVQGSRFIRGGIAENTPLSRYLAIRIIHAPITSLFARKWYTDTTNGFRGHRVSALINTKVSIFRSIFSDYELLAYIPIRMSRLGFRTCEAPVGRIYPESGKTPTKIRGLRGQARLLMTLFRASLGKFNP
jgi:dolichol-phosphate mannosyltransferase